MAHLCKAIDQDVERLGDLLANATMSRVLWRDTADKLVDAIRRHEASRTKCRSIASMEMGMYYGLKATEE